MPFMRAGLQHCGRVCAVSTGQNISRAAALRPFQKAYSLTHCPKNHPHIVAAPVHVQADKRPLALGTLALEEHMTAYKQASNPYLHSDQVADWLHLHACIATVHL